MIEESIIPQIEGFELISGNYEENPDFHDALLVEFRVMNSQDRSLSVELSLNTFWYDFDREYEPGELTTMTSPGSTWNCQQMIWDYR